MSTLQSVVPELVAEVGAALTREGRGDLAPQVQSGVIERCTYDPSVEAGYIYLVRPRPSPHFAKFAAPVHETIPFLEAGFNVDVDHDGHLYGIELLNRSDFFAKLREANAL
jgi:uncharacterized protein YuzE